MNADRLAPWYRWIEYAVYGRALERARFHFLPQLAGAERILVLGEGDGRALQRLLEVAPRARVDVIELSDGMIARAQRQVGPAAERVRFHQLDAVVGAWPAGLYDAVTAQFFLDCFDEPQMRQVIDRIYSQTRPGGLMLVTDFAIPKRGWRRLHASVLVWVMYRFFHFATALRARRLPGIDEYFRKVGAQAVASQGFRGDLILTAIWKSESKATETA